MLRRALAAAVLVVAAACATLSAVTGGFEGVSGQRRISGQAAFVEHEGRVYQLVGYAGTYDWLAERPSKA